MSAHPRGFANPLGRNPFACPRDRDGLPPIPPEMMERGLRRYCELWGIPVAKRGKVRLPPIPAPKGTDPRGRTYHLPGQVKMFVVGGAS